MSIANSSDAAAKVAVMRVFTAWKAKNARLNVGIDQGEFADRMGLTQSSISRMESGLVDFSLSNLTLWALICECRVTDLVDHGEAEEC